MILLILEKKEDTKKLGWKVFPSNFTKVWKTVFCLWKFSEVPLFIYNNAICNYEPEGTNVCQTLLSSRSEINSSEQSRHKTSWKAVKRRTDGKDPKCTCNALSHIMSTHHRQWLWVGGNFFLFQATRQGSKHAHKRWDEILNIWQKKSRIREENAINSGFQLGIEFFSGNLSKALTALLQFIIPIASESKFRKKKLVTGFLTIQNLHNLRTYPRNQDRRGYAYHCRYEGSKRVYVYFWNLYLWQ